MAGLLVWFLLANGFTHWPTKGQSFFLLKVSNIAFSSPLIISSYCGSSVTTGKSVINGPAIGDLF